MIIILEDYANIFNRRNLFLRFNGLLTTFRKNLEGVKIVGNVRVRNDLFHHYFHEYRYHLFSAYYFLEQIEQLEKAIMDQYNGLKPDMSLQNESEIEYDSFIVHEYMLRIMPFLNIVFLLQDRIMIIIKIFLNIKFKDLIKRENETEKYYEKRINQFKKKIRSFPSYATNYMGILNEFPKEMAKIIKKYWTNNGQELRKFRNLGQHQFNLLEETYIIRKPNERFVLYLPDNPDEINYQKLTYDKKRIATDYFMSEIQVFHDFIEELMKIIKIQPVRHEYGSKFSSKAKPMSEFEEGDLLKIWILKNDAILTSIGKKSPDGTSARLSKRKIKSKLDTLKWEIK